jgi:hypothetical protein
MPLKYADRRSRAVTVQHADPETLPVGHGARAIIVR